MQLTYKDFESILKISINLSTEKNISHILSSILESGMQITHCDASTLYLYEDGQLVFRIMKNISMGISRGEDNEPILDMPPVPLKEENVCAYTAIHREIVNIPDVYCSDRFEFSGPKRYDSISGYHTQSMLVIPIVNDEDELIGVLQMINAQDENGNVIPFDSKYNIIIQSLGSISAIELTKLQYIEEIKLQLHSFVEAFATAVDERTPYNGTHTRKVAEYAGMLADFINSKFDEGKCEEYFDDCRKEKLQLAALLHDIGKMVIPLDIMNRATRLDKDLITLESRYELLKAYYKIDFLQGKICKENYLNTLDELNSNLEFIRKINTVGYLDDDNYEKVLKLAEKKYVCEDGSIIPYLTEQETIWLSVRKGTLTAEARKIMESHAEMTQKILSKVHFSKKYKTITKWAASHHEYLDGSGYPQKLTASELDIETKILTIADIYDALTGRDRPYKKPMPKEKAFCILNNMANEGKLDAVLVKWMEEALD